jgi:hypothetical protein
MKSRSMLTAALAVGVLYLAAASNAQAFDLLDRMLNTHGGCGCEAAPTCCEPDHCGMRRVGLFQRLASRHQCCQPACGVEPACPPAPVCCEPCAPRRPGLLDHLRACRPSGCAAACDPKCGVEPACCDPCDTGCAPRRCGLLARLFSCQSACAPACDPKCGVEPTCCH